MEHSRWCVGSDAFGQLGGGEGDQPQSPIAPDLAGDAALQLSVGARHSCALTAGDRPDARKVKCWGDNQSNQAGGIDSQLELPRDVSGDLVPDEWVDVAAGVLYVRAPAADGEVSCWGGNEYGQVDPHADDLNLLRTASKIELDPVVDAVDIAVATTITCALDARRVGVVLGMFAAGTARQQRHLHGLTADVLRALHLMNLCGVWFSS